MHKNSLKVVKVKNCELIAQTKNVLGSLEFATHPKQKVVVFESVSLVPRIEFYIWEKAEALVAK